MDQTVTIQFQPVQVITWLIIGLIAGYFASLLIRGQVSAEGSIIVGLLGAVVGGFLFSILGIPVPQSLTEGVTLRFIDIIVAFIGAIIVLAIFGSRWGRRRFD
jgi:uncharacterized membrane protein YeaQ/YmgE (transglycosylase-associated protein family)